MKNLKEQECKKDLYVDFIRVPFRIEYEYRDDGTKYSEKCFDCKGIKTDTTYYCGVTVYKKEIYYKNGHLKWFGEYYYNGELYVEYGYRDNSFTNDNGTMLYSRQYRKEGGCIEHHYDDDGGLIKEVNIAGDKKWN